MIDEPAKLRAFIDYSRDAVVSKTLLKTPGGTLTLFAFDKGQSLSEHTAPFEAVVFLIEGSLEITIGGHARSLAEGELIRMPANVPHGLTALSSAKMLLTMFREK